MCFQETWRSNEIGKLWFRKVFCQTVANSSPSFWMDTVYMKVYVYLNWQKARIFFLCHSLHLHPMPSSLLTKQYLGILTKHTTRLVLSISLSIGEHSHIFQTGMEIGFDREEYYGLSVPMQIAENCSSSFYTLFNNQHVQQSLTHSSK